MERPHPILGAAVVLIAPIALAAVFTPADIAFVLLLGIKSCIAMAVIFPCVFFSWNELPAMLRRLWIFPVMGAVIAAIGMFLEVWFEPSRAYKSSSVFRSLSNIHTRHAQMKRFIALATVAISCIAWIPSANAALAEHFNKTISLLEVADSPCIFFQLTGVTEANPSAPSSAWFAIDKNQGNAKEMYALLLAVKMAGNSVTRVLTTGEIVCGQAKVGTIDL